MKKFLIGAAVGGVVAYIGHRKAKKWIAKAGEATATLEKSFGFDAADIVDNYPRQATRPNLRVVK